MNRDTFEVQSEQEGERLDKYLSSIYPDISRSFFQRILKENQILVNDKPQKANYRLKTDDIVDVTIPDAVQTPILPQYIPLDILYEDDDVLVVNKPKGMVVPLSRALQRYSCKCHNVPLQGLFKRHKRRNTARYSASHRHGHHRLPYCLQER